MKDFNMFFTWVWERWEEKEYACLNKDNPTFEEHFVDMVPGGIMRHIETHYLPKPLSLPPYSLVWLVSLLYDDFWKTVDKNAWIRIPSGHLTTDWTRHGH